MRTYKKKFIRQRIDRDIRRAVETKNAIIWSIDEAERKANVRIQKSNTTISAYFPTAWYIKPQWCKIGAPVRILFNGGQRGKVELLGPGIVIPYPQTGAVWPDAPSRADQLINGCHIFPVNSKQGRVIITVGTLVINNSTVTVPSITMTDGGEWYMGDGGLMDDVAAVIPVGLALNLDDLDGREEPHTSYRINTFYVDTSGEVHIDTGWEFMAAYHAWAKTGGGSSYSPDDFGSDDTLQILFIPDSVRPGAEIINCPDQKNMRINFADYVFDSALKPEVPENNFWIGEVVSWEYNGDTGPIIDTPNINFQWFKIDTPHQVYSRRPSTIQFQDSDQVLSMDWLDGPLTIYFKAMNNVGTDLQLCKSRPSVNVSITNGNGEIAAGPGCGGAGYTTDPIDIQAHNGFDEAPDVCAPMKNLWTLIYKRDNEVTDESPTIHLVYGDEPAITLDFTIILYDVGGGIM